jgi:glycosyltransferase involved in cell wall biosynthesis
MTLDTSPPPRLVIDGRRLTAERTGVGRYLEVLLAEWARVGMPLSETLVVLHDRAGLARVPPGIDAVVVGEGWPGLVWEMFGLGRILRRGDLLFAPANLIPANWGGPSVLVLHDALQERNPSAFPRLARWNFGTRYRIAARKATRVLTPSHASARDVGHFYGVSPDRLSVINLGIDRAFFENEHIEAETLAARERLGLGAAGYFLFVGKPAVRRNLPALLEAFSRHRRDFPQHRLVLVGPGHHRAEAGEEVGILRPGHVDESTLRGLLAGAIALLYPSEAEGFGLPIIEAMASGCPVATLRTGALAEAAGEAAWWISDPSPAAIASVMHMLATDDATRASLIARGIDQVSRFRPERFAEAVTAEIQAVAEAWMNASRSTRPGR